MNYQEKQQQNHLKNFLSVTERNFLKSYEGAKNYTMLSLEVLYDLQLSTKYLATNGIKGDIVEFGVWQEGSIQAAVNALQNHNGVNRIYGYDTFEGHPEPNENEIDINGENMR